MLLRKLSHLEVGVGHLWDRLDVLASLELSTHGLEGVDGVLHILHRMCCRRYHSKDDLTLRDYWVDDNRAEETIVLAKVYDEVCTLLVCG